MAYRRIAIELLYTVTAAMALAAAFKGACWAYPPGRTTIWTIGVVTIVAMIAMAWPQLRDAWRADRAAVRGPARGG